MFAATVGAHLQVPDVPGEAEAWDGSKRATAYREDLAILGGDVVGEVPQAIEEAEVVGAVVEPKIVVAKRVSGAGLQGCDRGHPGRPLVARDAKDADQTRTWGARTFRSQRRERALYKPVYRSRNTRAPCMSPCST